MWDQMWDGWLMGRLTNRSVKRQGGPHGDGDGLQTRRQRSGREVGSSLSAEWRPPGHGPGPIPRSRPHGGARIAAADPAS